MHAALYYPFTGPKGSIFLKSALFLWDSVDFIVPSMGYHISGLERDAAEAIELIGRNYVPTKQDMQDTHEELVDICSRPLPPALSFEIQRPDDVYNFYPQKLLNDTWEMLERSKLAEVVKGADGIQRATTGALFGYYMMSILAVCCSRGRKSLVTDECDPYRALANLLVDDPKSMGNPTDNWHGRLVALSFSGPDFADIPLSKLVDLRKREDMLLKDLRHTFLEKVDQTARDISANAGNEDTVRDLIQSFCDNMERDLAELKRALGRSGASLLLSREFGFSVLAATTAVTIAPMLGIITMGGLAKGLIDYQDRRRDILRKHPASWLLAATGPRMPIV